MFSFNDRLIFHCDCNNFFASCECLDNPELKNVPMAVAGDPEHRTGIVVAKNELAKRYGVKTTDTVWQARQKCPQLVLVPPRHGIYSQISRQVNAIYREYTELLEPASIDESYLDMTGAPAFFGMSPKELADQLRERVREEVGITISVGVSFNKIFAKLGSDYKKPDATTIITQDNFREILWPLPVQDMMFVGKSSAAALRARGVDTIGALARTDKNLLCSWLGKGGEQLWRHANGFDDEPVRLYGEKSVIKSVSRGSTFCRDLTCMEEITACLSPLVDDVASTLRRHQLKGTVVQVQIKDPHLRVLCRQTTLDHYTFLYREIMDTAIQMILTHWPVARGAPIRAITVAVNHLTPANEAVEQISMLDPTRTIQRQNQEKLEIAIDAIRRKHGHQSISFSCLQQGDL